MAGSSRSTRDDSRHYERERGHDRKRSRSRSPRRRYSPPPSKRDSPKRSSSTKEDHRKDYEKKHTVPIEPSADWELNESPKENLQSDEVDVPAPPPPPRISKITIDLPKTKAPIKINIGATSSKPAVLPKPTVASVFNNDDDDDDEPEEMPAEARMRMRNIGRDTPTSAGPNSFGKTKQGFCDAKKVFEKNLKQALEMTDKGGSSKYPQTIYKIKGP